MYGYSQTEMIFNHVTYIEKLMRFFSVLHIVTQIYCLTHMFGPGAVVCQYNVLYFPFALVCCCFMVLSVSSCR